MKSLNYISLFALIIATHTSSAQSDFNITFPETELETIAGNQVTFHGALTTELQSTYNFDMYASNINLPENWVFYLCTPYNCLMPFADSITFEYFPTSPGDEEVQVKVETSALEAGVGTLDLTVINLADSSSLTFNLTVTSTLSGISIVSEECKSEPIGVYSLDGRRLDSYERGYAIEVYSDGSYRKVYR